VTTGIRTTGGSAITRESRVAEDAGDGKRQAIGGEAAALHIQIATTRSANRARSFGVGKEGLEGESSGCCAPRRQRPALQDVRSRVGMSCFFPHGRTAIGAIRPPIANQDSERGRGCAEED